MKAVSLLLLTITGSQAFLWGESPDWDGLRVGFGVNPFSSTTFAGMPRTRDDAIKDGWKRDATVACQPGSSYAGHRYIKDGDNGAMLLFDKNGFISGIQAGIPKTLKYPLPNNLKYGAFVEETNMWVATAYFIQDPSTICSQGRSQADFDNTGTGNALAFQVGTTPDKLMRIPMVEKDVEAKTKFVAGKCFYTMGMHYWYNISKDLSCDDTFPYFLLYNKGKLNGFGFAFNPDYKNSFRWEHPTKSQYPMFMKDPPTCLGKDGPVSTLHVYMTDSPRLNFC